MCGSMVGRRGAESSSHSAGAVRARCDRCCFDCAGPVMGVFEKRRAAWTWQQAKGTSIGPWRSARDWWGPRGWWTQMARGCRSERSHVLEPPQSSYVADETRARPQTVSVSDGARDVRRCMTRVRDSVCLPAYFFSCFAPRVRVASAQQGEAGHSVQLPGESRRRREDGRSGSAPIVRPDSDQARCAPPPSPIRLLTRPDASWPPRPAESHLADFEAFACPAIHRIARSCLHEIDPKQHRRQHAESDPALDTSDPPAPGRSTLL